MTDPVGVRRSVVDRVVGAVKGGLSVRDAVSSVDRALRAGGQRGVSMRESCGAIGVLEAQHGRFKGNEVKED